jgi:hypothetical protein
MLTAKEELEKLLADAPDVAGEIDVFNLDKICNDFGNTTESGSCGIRRSISETLDYLEYLENKIAS